MELLGYKTLKETEANVSKVFYLCLYMAGYQDWDRSGRILMPDWKKKLCLDLSTSELSRSGQMKTH